MAEINDYDWSEIFGRSDNNNIPPARDAVDVIYEFKDGETEPNMCGVVGVYGCHCYYSFSAWTDYTGWGCQDGVNWYGPFDSVMGAMSALTQDERRWLGFEHGPEEHKELFRDE